MINVRSHKLIALRTKTVIIMPRLHLPLLSFYPEHPGRLIQKINNTRSKFQLQTLNKYITIHKPKEITEKSIINKQSPNQKENQIKPQNDLELAIARGY